MGEGKKKDKMMRRCGEKRLTLGQWCSKDVYLIKMCVCVYTQRETNSRSDAVKMCMSDTHTQRDKLWDSDVVKMCMYIYRERERERQTLPLVALNDMHICISILYCLSCLI
jgi:hypothetical protein